ncbi:hypothetical protein [Paracoccus sp. Z118]|nr:hypothetical protein [Paracoccus sp. Z118]
MIRRLGPPIWGQEIERNAMSRAAMHRLSFYLLMGVTLYASLVGA